tara:strand:- start:399 stop:575 length:177 start_codon:yes stop_codon:yes gene_type:complete
MPDTSRFKSISVDMKTYNQLKTQAKSRFEVPVSLTKIIRFMLDQTEVKTLKKKNGKTR